MNTYKKENQNRVAIGGRICRRGFSLLELLIALAILMATAVLVMPLFSAKIKTVQGKITTPNEITTLTTMAVIRDAIAGEEGVLATLANSPDALPREISDLVNEEPPAHVKTVAPRLCRFNPYIGIGWRGPYLFSTGKNDLGKPTVVDGWGHEFQLQVDFNSNGEVDEEESKYIRVVSAGPNGQIDTPKDKLKMKPGIDSQNNLTMDDCGDDLVIFLCVPDVRQ